MKKTIKTNKLTFDLTDKNKVMLEKLRIGTHIPFGRLVNILIDSVCYMPDRLRDVLQEVLEQEGVLVKEEIDSLKVNGNDFFCRELKLEQQVICNLLMFVNNEQFNYIEKTQKEMKNIPLADGYLVIPADWVMVNEEQARNSHYAAVLECAGSIESKIPHFIYFYERANACDFSSSQEKDFYDKCIEKCPEFKAVLDESNSNHLVQNPDGTVQYPSIKDFSKKAKVGIFFIGDAGDHPSGEPPCGAVIVRSNIREI